MLIYILFKIIADKYQYMFLFFKLFNLIFTYPILPDAYYRSHNIVW